MRKPRQGRKKTENGLQSCDIPTSPVQCRGILPKWRPCRSRGATPLLTSRPAGPVFAAPFTPAARRGQNSGICPHFPKPCRAPSCPFPGRTAASIFFQVNIPNTSVNSPGFSNAWTQGETHRLFSPPALRFPTRRHAFAILRSMAVLYKQQQSKRHEQKTQRTAIKRTCPAGRPARAAKKRFQPP